ncbi:MAG: Na/Pi cotransporter family protein [Bacteriovoracaceae bacterium]|nr:Na/Pi cotransporter family protein [Bacteriovoracaceae bacterium]
MEIDIFKIVYTVLGGLGVFFYGMKGMSDGLQSIAGHMIKNIINTITKNRILAVLVGIVVTMLVQSSSVTTVMVVGFVNAGLMSLVQAIGVIFGANIGTTITGWIISIKIGKYGLLLIGLGIFPTLFAKSNRWKQIGKIMFSIGMIFFGLQIMSGAFKPLRSNEEFLSFLTYFSEPTYLSYFACIVVGCILTMIIQSSSAMLGITIAMAASGVIPFQTAAALVLGENIGTTITALLASVGGNVNAKRAARAHAIFNVFGVMVMLAIFPVFLEFIEWLIPGDANFINAAGDRPNIAVHIATGHTIFNVTATLLFIPFLPVLAKIVTRITPDKALKEQHHLVVLGNPSDMLPAMAIAQASKEMEKLTDIVGRMFRVTEEFMLAEKIVPSLQAKIKDYEQITDNIQKEVSVFICKLLERPLSADESKKSQGLVRIASELESIGDYLEKLTFFKARFIRDGKLKGQSREGLVSFYKEVSCYFNDISEAITSGNHDHSVFDRKSETLRMMAEELREKQIVGITNGEITPLSALTFTDMVESLRKARGHIHNISQSLHRMS